jgi:hypothetical protein
MAEDLGHDALFPVRTANHQRRGDAKQVSHDPCSLTTALFHDQFGFHHFTMSIDPYSLDARHTREYVGGAWR